jgi:hypothetical protein
MTQNSIAPLRIWAMRFVASPRTMRDTVPPEARCGPMFWFCLAWTALLGCHGLDLLGILGRIGLRPGQRVERVRHPYPAVPVLQIRSSRRCGPPKQYPICGHGR